MKAEMVRVWSKWGMALKQALLGESKGHRAFWGWTVVQENLNEVSKEHMSDFGEEVTNRLKLRRRLSWKHIFREGDCYKDYGKGRA